MTVRQIKSWSTLLILGLGFGLACLVFLQSRWHMNVRVFDFVCLSLVVLWVLLFLRLQRAARTARARLSAQHRAEVDAYFYAANKKTSRYMKLWLGWLLLCVPLAWRELKHESWHMRAAAFLMWAAFLSYAAYLLRHSKQQQQRYEAGGQH